LRDEPIPVKVDVSCFIAEDQLAHCGDRFVANVLLNDAVVAGADDFDDEENKQLELHAQRSSASVEETHGETISHRCGANALYGMRKQPRMLTFLRKPKIHEPVHVLPRIAEYFGVAATSLHSPPPSPS
jgi:hypothetical protein